MTNLMSSTGHSLTLPILMPTPSLVVLIHAWLRPVMLIMHHNSLRLGWRALQRLRLARVPSQHLKHLLRTRQWPSHKAHWAVKCHRNIEWNLVVQVERAPLVTHRAHDLLQLPLGLVLLAAHVRHGGVRDVEARDTRVTCAGTACMVIMSMAMSGPEACSSAARCIATLAAAQLGLVATKPLWDAV